MTQDSPLNLKVQWFIRPTIRTDTRYGNGIFQEKLMPETYPPNVKSMLLTG